MLAFLLTFLDVTQIATPSGKESTPFEGEFGEEFGVWNWLDFWLDLWLYCPS